MMNGSACAKGIRVYLLSERGLATLIRESCTVNESIERHKNTFRVFAL